MSLLDMLFGQSQEKPEEKKLISNSDEEKKFIFRADEIRSNEIYCEKSNFGECTTGTDYVKLKANHIMINGILWPKNEPKIGDKLEVVSLGPPIVLEWRS